ncbi:MAG: DUF1328 domain-containing protein [Dongiaceae bacterium]
MRWVLLFLVAAFGFGIMGFSASTPMIVSIGQLLLGISLVLLLVALIVCALQKGGPARQIF